MCDDVSIIMYADDTVIYTHGKSATEVAKALTKAMQKVALWLHNSGLTLTLEKSVTMFFTNRVKLKECPDVSVNGQTINNVDKFKYLGVTLDPTLSFKNHVKKLNAMIMPHFLYCITSCSQSNKTVLKSQYKSALKIHDKKPQRYHHCHILNKYEI